MSSTLNRLLDLSYWENRTWKKEALFQYYLNNKEEKKLILININKNNIKYSLCKNYQKGDKIYAIDKFLKSIIKYKPNLELTFLISLIDEIYDTTQEIYDLNINKKVNYVEHDFHWGISKKDNNIISIQEGMETKFDFPIFSFSKTENQKEVIIFPHKNLLKNEFYDDKLSFDNKINNVPINRFSNIRADLFMPSRFKMLELTYKYPDMIDYKGGMATKHPGHNSYLIHKTFVELYKYKNIIDKSINTDKFMELVNIRNFIEKEKFFNYKYLICHDSYYNLIDYALLNSVLLRYKQDKTCYYEDYVFEDNKDIIIFDEKNYVQKYLEIKDNKNKIQNMIINRKDKVNKYLKYDKLVENYSLLLEKYSKLQKRNEY